jgi:hypothetical protein
MSNLPNAVDKYFRDRGKDPAKLNDLPKTKDAFDKLTQKDLDAIDMLNKLGKAIEQDLDDGHHVGATADAATPEEKVDTYLYAIH